MYRARACSALFFALSLTACGGDSPSETPSTDDLVVERSTENGVELVRNLSGSTWGSGAHLEEELSIGVMEGDPAYMFGTVSSVWATEERVYVVDSQLPAIRVYDRSGAHLFDVGRGGEGPGEFERPRSLSVLSDGTMVVADSGNRRVVFFDADGGFLRTWTPDDGNLGSYTHALNDGRLLAQRYTLPEDAGGGPVMITSFEIVEVLEDGSTGEARPIPDFGHDPPSITVNVGGGVMMMGGGFLGLPSRVFTVRPDGAIVAGVGDAYNFEIHHEDGRRTVVERYWEPVPVNPDAMDYQIRTIEGQFREMAPDYTYDGPDPAESWPAFIVMAADRNSRLWLRRQTGSRRVQDCFENPREDPASARRQPCWESVWVLDVFAPDGAYLGELRRPEDLDFRTVFVDGDEYWAAVEDEFGVVRVKRYRIVTEEGS